MRQAINYLQSVVAGFELVNEANVQVMIDTPHPAQCQAILEACHKVEIETALELVGSLRRKGYAPLDILSTLFRVAKSATFLGDQKQLEFIRVPHCVASSCIVFICVHVYGRLYYNACVGTWDGAHAGIRRSSFSITSGRLHGQIVSFGRSEIDVEYNLALNIFRLILMV